MYISSLASVLGIGSIPSVLELTVRLSTCQTPYSPSVASEPNTPSVARRRLPRIIVIPLPILFPVYVFPLGRHLSYSHQTLHWADPGSIREIPAAFPFIASTFLFSQTFELHCQR